MAGWARVSRGPGFGGPALSLPSGGRWAVVGRWKSPFPAPDDSPPVWLPRNQMLWEASRACSSIWARGVKNAAAIKNPINFQPLVRAAGLSAVGGVLSVVNLSPLCTALICRSDGRFPGR